MGNQKRTEDVTGVSGRRKFLNRLWGFLGGLACFELGWISLSIFKSQKDKQKKKKEEVFVAVGKVDDYRPNTVTSIAKGQFYLACLDDGSFLALSRICTHLGCSIPWDDEAGKFVCPCHGSTFDINGEVLTPPATRALESYPLRIEDGAILVNSVRSMKRLQDGKPRSIKG